MRNEIALSTGWNQWRHNHGNAIAEEILGLGFTCLEGRRLTVKQMAELAVLVKAGRIQMHSLHNFCPEPEARNLAAKLSSPDESLRRQAVTDTLATVRQAEETGASVIVVHCGGVAMKTNIGRIFRLAIDAGLKDKELGRVALSDFIKERAALAAPFLDAVRRSLDEICGKLLPGVRLGLENPYNYNEMPTIDEMEALLHEFGGSAGYWHDTGHAHVLEYSGFYEHNEWIRRNGPKLIGTHLHDSIGIHDHVPPGTGEVDFAALLPYVNDSVLRVMEMHKDVSGDDIPKGVEFLRKIGF